jgi:hypothetical protein
MPVLICFKVMPSIVLSARMRLLLRSASGIGAQGIGTHSKRSGDAGALRLIRNVLSSRSSWEPYSVTQPWQWARQWRTSPKNSNVGTASSVSVVRNMASANEWRNDCRAQMFWLGVRETKRRESRKDKGVAVVRLRPG